MVIVSIESMLKAKQKMNLRDIALTSSGIYSLVEVDDHEFWVQEGTELAEYKVLSVLKMNVYLRHSSDDSDKDDSSTPNIGDPATQH